MTKERIAYNEAMRFLTDAVNALDQAHACMKDVGLDGLAAKHWGRHIDVADMVKLADDLLGELQRVTCDDCGALLAESDDCLAGCCPSICGKENN